MSEWVFLGEQIEEGISFQLVMNQSTGQYYRFEPLATKLRCNLKSILRQDVENRRNLIGEGQEQAIVPVIGPLGYEGRYWLGWNKRNGQYLFELSVKKFKRPLKSELADLFPLIRSYCLWHQAGLVVGRPEWSRLFKDGKGIFMLDPKPLHYIARPFINPPLALERCRPTEDYRNQPLGAYGDVFYLGLIIYYFITGELPFPLHNGWPTRAILNGAIIDLKVYRPDLPFDLRQTILSMLAPDPLQRPTSQIVKELWQNYLDFETVNIRPGPKKKQQKQVSLCRKPNFIKSYSQWVFPIGLIVLLIIAFLVFHPRYNGPKKRSNTYPPLKAAASFYQEMGHLKIRDKEIETAQNLRNDFVLAAERRLEMVVALLSKPLFEVDRMKLIIETKDSAIVEADLIWWEWSAEGWLRKRVRETLHFSKTRNKLKLINRSRLQN